jgi:EAL domain-containing protein (putative c-di-GMP-specific phosphodiesterase class I)
MFRSQAILDGETTSTTWQSGPLHLATDTERVEELHQALESGQLVVYYQPVVELQHGHVVAVEALVRWLHPEVGLIAPGRFITLAEQSGVLREITAYVLEQAAAQHAAWSATGLELPIAVNLSACSLRDPLLVDKVTGACRRHRVDHGSLSLEITEAAVMADPGVAAEVLDELTRSGFDIAIDDFGTGSSSLSYLRNLPVSVVKIDRSFVPNVAETEADAHIVRGLIEISHGLGKQVVAEGVENEGTLEILRFMSCEFGQGYHWSRPVPADQLRESLAHGLRLAPASTRYDVGDAPAVRSLVDVSRIAQ